LIFFIALFGTWIAHLLSKWIGRGDGQVSVARPATAHAISVAVDRFDDAPGQRITGQSSIDQSSDRSCTPRWLVHVIESALI